MEFRRPSCKQEKYRSIKNLQKGKLPIYDQSDLNNIFAKYISGIKVGRATKTDLAEESTTSATAAKTNKKENTDEGSILETEKGTNQDQDNASGQELEDLEK